MNKILILSPKKRHVFKQIDAMDDFPNSSLGYFLTRQLAIELVYGIKFVGCPSQPMDFTRHSVHK